MKTISGVLVISVLFFMLSISNYSKTPRSVEITGFVYDTDINYINNSRIEIIDISGIYKNYTFFGVDIDDVEAE